MRVEACRNIVRALLLKKVPFLLVTVFSSLPAVGQSSDSGEFDYSFDSLDAIYGQDNRYEPWEVERLPHLSRAIRATAMFVRRSDVAKQPPTDSTEPGRCKIIGRTLENRYSLCPEERFGKQPSPGYCSGVLVGSDLLITAGHCMRSSTDCANTAIVFDFQMSARDRDTRDLTVPATSVYVCTAVLERAQDSVSGIDFAIIRLNRKAEDRLPLKIRREGKVSSAAKLTTLGYQSGLPLKVSLSGRIRSNDKMGYFTASLDTTDGSSGSPVIDAETGLLEGIVVRGQTAYQFNGSCFETKI